MGDMNIDTLAEDPVVTKLKNKNTLIEHQLKIHKSPPTRVTQTSATRLDYCYSNLTDSKLNIFKTTLSDHCGVILTTDIQINKTPIVKTKSRKINSNTLTELRICLGRETWKNVVDSNSTEDKYDNLIEIFKSHFHISCPERILKQKNLSNVYLSYRYRPGHP